MYFSKLKRITTFLMAISVAFLSLTACSQKSNNSSIAEVSSDAADDAVKSTISGSVSEENILGYENKLFDTSYVHTIDISISDDDWADLTENPLKKTKYEVSITIDGETLNSVSFATKGNTSLSSVADDKDSNRYSFKVNFGKYVDGQTYYGLNKLNLNNLYADATYMKDYISYEIFRQAGVDSPLVSYVWVTINGEDHGLYIAIEDISESYLKRTNNGEGELYKPETEQLDNMDKMAGGMQKFDGENFQLPQNKNGNDIQPSVQDRNIPEPPENFDDMIPSDASKIPDTENIPDMGEMPFNPDNHNMLPMNGDDMGFGSTSNGADLVYSDDEIESYSDIFDNAVTDADENAKKRVINALKGLSDNGSSEEYLDTDEIIRYFAAHNFVLNYDSYTGNMLHNYYLYENDGKLSMLPWDYNLAFGGFSGDHSETKNDDATTLVNTGIDTPLSGTDESSRPMWSWIKWNEEYLEKYHEVFDELLTNYFESGAFEKQTDDLYEMILRYVEKDSSAFYNTEEFKTAYSTLKKFCQYRAESIRAQLNGTLSTETDKQDTDKQIVAADITVNDMGGQGGGPNNGDIKTPPEMNQNNNE
ncbi:MAG: CotH kinase family protein [Porcipelethomonas sp.]